MLLYFILTSIGLLLFLIAVIGMIWMVRSGQADDLDTPALRMLADDQQAPDEAVDTPPPSNPPPSNPPQPTEDRHRD